MVKYLKDFYLNNNLKIKNSKIAGNGIFTRYKIIKGINLGLSFLKIANTKNEDKNYLRTDLGKYVNHSDIPNIEIIKQGNKFYYYSLKNLKENEELLIDYKNFDFNGKRNFK